jgi:hypothetical protein
LEEENELEYRCVRQKRKKGAVGVVVNGSDAGAPSG